MNPLRRMLLWLTLLLTIALIVLSGYGAVLGAEKARDLFNSTPLVLYWILLATLLAAGFVTFPRLIRSPGRLGVHLGALLVLVGAMMNSVKGHALLDRYFKLDKIPVGQMVIYQGQESDLLLGDRGQPIAQLPFTLRLQEFSIKYYPADDPRWLLVSETVCPEHGQAERKLMEWRQGQPVPMSCTDITVTVLEYLPRAALVYPQGAENRLEVLYDGQRAGIPAEAGQEVTAPGTTIRVRVEEIVQHPAMGEAGPSQVLKARVLHPGGQDEQIKILHGRPAHSRQDEKLFLVFRGPQPIAARADESSQTPAMRVRLARAGRSTEAWLLPLPKADHDMIDVNALLPATTAPATAGSTATTTADPVATAPADAHGTADEHAAENGHSDTALLYIFQPVGEIRKYLADISVVEDGKTVHKQILAVNQPMHYGGYHFYQDRYDSQGLRYTVLLVRSDTGLYVVWTGFILMCAGVFWSFWFMPAVSAMRKRGANAR